MTQQSTAQYFQQLPPVPDDKPVLIAGPTASGKSALALEVAERFGGVIVNADASQVYDCWRVVSARPSEEEEARAPHRLYGHIAYDQDYSTGHWLREVTPLLNGAQRPIIVGGTGLYFTALTEGMAQIPTTPAEIRAEADQISLPELITGVDDETLAGLDVQNRARVQRAWEVQRATGRSLLSWQSDTPPPVLNLKDTVPIVLDVDKAWLLARIERRFDQMLEQGAIEEVRAMLDRFDPNLPACKAIGVPELRAYLSGSMTLDQARDRATIATRQFAKRQRTWFRARMKAWNQIDPSK
ncbi:MULTISPECIES: tRNA (adenosine(37)-N6)-dimethylallyltransferase MiaA [unclassified Ruegeria]|uniref:tRNA (adenosine(37)-N6)-dimethylallyltransferase MiaA n=1 Tax=unclassified Ruegeria TaxID=2625375 RepID=UPI001488C778|nr:MULTISPECIES: tRNA (adenosine(37)-N6)-dimethylallyltransferase MiaA [unclassified Ruegeria]NOD63534.1 tRNA (adenosine(37)-N6)-dimethylallyltransferase MiaA [Ruegeria sp. HKCCD6109]